MFRAAIHAFKPLCELRWNMEHRQREVVAVGHEFAHDRHWRRMRRFHFAHDTAGLNAQLGVEFPRELPHATVLGETKHMQPVDPPVAGREQEVFEQRRSHALALPCPLDAQGHLGVARRLEQAQLGRAAQHAVDEETVDDRAAECGGLAVSPDEVVRNGAAEPIAPAFAIQAQQVPSVELGLADPQFVDAAAVYQRSSGADGFATGTTILD